MQDAFLEFEWTVAPRYEWQDWLDDKGQPVVVPAEGTASLESATAIELLSEQCLRDKRVYGPLLRPVMNDAKELRRYQPMQRAHAALFREFAALDYRNQNEMLDFAGKYGSIGLLAKHQSVRFRGKDGEFQDHHAYGEPFLGWALEICLLREGLRLSDRKRSPKDLRRFKGIADRSLQWVQARMAFDKAGEPKVVLEPLTLIAAMWLQLMLAVTGDKQFVACKFCRRMFEISTDATGFRSHREFCTNSCKTLDYRKRKRAALRFASEGIELRRIAEKTSTEVATVRGWLAAARESRQAEKAGEK